MKLGHFSALRLQSEDQVGDFFVIKLHVYLICFVIHVMPSDSFGCISREFDLRDKYQCLSVLTAVVVVVHFSVKSGVQLYYHIPIHQVGSALPSHCADNLASKCVNLHSYNQNKTTGFAMPYTCSAISDTCTGFKCSLCAHSHGGIAGPLSIYI